MRLYKPRAHEMPVECGPWSTGLSWLGKVEALAVELLRGVDICTDDTRDALTLMMRDAADSLLTLLDTLMSIGGGQAVERKRRLGIQPAA